MTTLESSFPTLTASRLLPGLPHITAAERSLLLMASLPLFDGVFVSALLGQALSSSFAAVSFGVGVFSGSGCLAAVVALEGSYSQRLLTVARDYLIVGLGALMLVAALPLVRAILPPDMHVYSALILLGVARDMAGVRSDARPLSGGIIGSLLRQLRMVMEPQTVLCMLVVVSCLRLVESGPPVLIEAQAVDVTGAAFAVMAGFGLTAGMLTATTFTQRLVDPLSIRRGGAAALFTIALLMLQYPLPVAAPLVACASGVVIGAARRFRQTPGSRVS